MCMVTLQIHSAYYRTLIKQVSNNLSLQQISFSSKSTCHKSLTKKISTKYIILFCVFTQELEQIFKNHRMTSIS